jgi:hypothetical protein
MVIDSFARMKTPSARAKTLTVLNVIDCNWFLSYTVIEVGGRVARITRRDLVSLCQLAECDSRKRALKGDSLDIPTNQCNQRSVTSSERK